jgi:hypothetical protein
MPVGVDPGGDQGVHADHPAVLADLHRDRIDPHECVRAGIQRALAKRRYLRVEVGGHLRDLRAGQRLDPELGQPLHPPGGHPQQVGGGHHADQGLLGTVLDELFEADVLDWSRGCIDAVSVRAKRGRADRPQPHRPRQTRLEVPPAV